MSLDSERPRTNIGQIGPDSLPSQRSVAARVRTLLHGAPRARAGKQEQPRLIAALNDVASAVSSTVSVDEVLEIIVERAKWITNTEKAALVLTHDNAATLDLDTLVVRGSRDEHPETWWAAELERVSPTLFRERSTYLNYDSAHTAWLLCTPITVKDRAVGLLAAINSEGHDFTADQVDFIAILSAFAATAIENARLAEQNKYVLLASERDRIAREMHDGIAQSLFSVALGLEVCRKQVIRNPSGVAARLEELQDMVDMSRSELRRFIYDLRPVKLQELGLIGALEYWIHEVTVGKSVEGDLTVSGEQRHLTPAGEACLYQVAKESISNIIKHAEATQFRVEVTYTTEGVAMRISDDGKGFEHGSALRRSQAGGSLGLRSIEERVQRERGRLDVVSEPGNGTTIYVRLPV